MNANAMAITQARDALRAREISAVDLTMSCRTAIDASDALNAFVHRTPEIALDQARAADARLAAGDAPDICGIPLGIKDVFCTKGVASQAGSNILRGFKPEYESTVTTKLFADGAVMLGKLNMDEFAMGSSNESSCYGPAVNPWKVDEVLRTCASARPAPIPAAPSASPPPLPASPASSRPMAASVAGA